MTAYEVMYIIRPDIEEDAQTALMERFNEILTENGAEIEKIEEIGKRRLEYEINNYRDGYYVVVYFNGGEDAVSEFDRQAKFTDDILRHLIVRSEE